MYSVMNQQFWYILRSKLSMKSTFSESFSGSSNFIIVFLITYQEISSVTSKESDFEGTILRFLQCQMTFRTSFVPFGLKWKSWSDDFYKNSRPKSWPWVQDLNFTSYEMYLYFWYRVRLMNSNAWFEFFFQNPNKWFILNDLSLLDLSSKIIFIEKVNWKWRINEGTKSDL